MRGKKRLDHYYPYLLILPTVLLIIIFIMIPILDVFKLSAQDYSTNSLSGVGTFVGFENFRKILMEDEVFRKAAGISLKWVACTVAGQLVIGMGIALLLNQKVWFRGLFRSVTFMPWAVSGVLATMLWTIMYNQNVGVINDLLIKAGILEKGVAWLSNPHTTFWAVVVTELWRGIPFFAIMILAGLQSIPEEIYESSRLDGANKFQTLFQITIPMIKPAIMSVLTLGFVYTFKVFDLVWVMTKGGPVNATELVSTYAYKLSFDQFQFSKGAAAANILFLILFVVGIFYIKLINDEDEVM